MNVHEPTLGHGPSLSRSGDDHYLFLGCDLLLTKFASSPTTMKTAGTLDAVLDVCEESEIRP